MAQNLFKSDDIHEMLSGIPEGTPVLDRNHNKIGKVKYILLGDEAGQDPIAKPAEFYDLPTEVQLRLTRNGFLQIDCGFFAPDCFAIPEQIAELTDDGVRLKVLRESLLTA
jgi:hypothetical protein